jgi:hypothetical protein
MHQLRIRMTPELDQALAEYMRLRCLKTRSDAVRLALQDALEHGHQQRTPPNFSKWLGLGNQGPENPNRRFRSDDDL